MSEDHPDLIVLGAGATGLAAARAGRSAGRRVVLLDPHPPGGDCTHTGCVPSKALLETARRVQAARDGARYGFTAPVEVDMAAVQRRVMDVVAAVSADEDAETLTREGIDFRQVTATFTGPGTVLTADGDRLSAPQIVIATGASAAVPPLPGLAETGYLTNESVFSLTELPGHLVLLGGGPIACELAQAFRRLGADVTIVEKAPGLLGKDDPEAAVVLRTVLEREGVTVRTGVDVQRVSAGPVLHLCGGQTVSGTHLLVAVGRTPRTSDLGLDLAGVAVDPDTHRVVIDEHLRTTQDGIWAAGDCASPFQFTHTGDDQGRLAVRNAFGRRKHRFDTSALPWVTFTDPEVGHVGMTEAEAFAAHGPRARVAVVPFSGQDRARCAGETDGFVKLIAAPRTPLARASKSLVGVVGMTVVCPVGGEVVHEAVPMIRARTLAARLALGTHAYPTWSLTTRMAAAQLFGSYGGRTARAAQADGGASAWPLS